MFSKRQEVVQEVSTPTKPDMFELFQAISAIQYIASQLSLANGQSMNITSSTVSAGKARGVKDAMEFWVEVHMDHTNNYTSFLTQRMRFVVTSGAILTIDIQHYINGITALGIKPEKMDEIKHKIEAIIRCINPGQLYYFAVNPREWSFDITKNQYGGFYDKSSLPLANQLLKRLMSDGLINNGALQSIKQQYDEIWTSTL